MEDFQCHLPWFWIHCIESVLIHIIDSPLSFLKGDLKSTVVAADRSEAGTLTSCTKAILNTTTESLPAVTYQHFQVCWFWSHPLLSLSQWNKLILLCNSDLTCPIFARAVCAQTLYLPFWSNTFGMVSFGKGSPLRRVPWMITTSPEYLFISRSRARDVYQVNQLYKTALERGHRVITHARQRTLSHHDSLQSRDAMASIPYLGIKPRHIKTTRPARH